MRAIASQTTQQTRAIPLTGSRRPVGGALRRPDTVQRILAAAEQAFAERGLAGARTDQIARAAKVNKALLYYYFKSKDELYGAVLDSLFQKQRASIEAARAQSASLPHASKPHQNAILAFIAGFMDFATHHPNYVRLMQRQVMTRGPHFDYIIKTYWEPSFSRLLKTVEDGISVGEFRAVDPAQAVITLISITIFYFTAAPVLREKLGGDLLQPRAVATRRQAVFDFLEHGLFRHAGRKR
jgi:TetR/AcrR family transcriptional regulator